MEFPSLMIAIVHASCHHRADSRRCAETITCVTEDYPLRGSAIQHCLRYAVRMARPFRIEYEGALHHVTSRGDGREAVSEDDGARNGFLRLLGQDNGDRGLPWHPLFHGESLCAAVRRRKCVIA